MANPQEQAQQAYKAQVNWRAVSRADPAVQEIIATCSFCSVYLWDKTKDEWARQKQEGPLFLVKRDKEPEYGLYMLNRAGLKNVLWPLIAGQMRLTPTGDRMLIVERKGEGVKTGIHFADGMTSVLEFQSIINRICSLPGQSDTLDHPQAEHQVQSQGQPPSTPQQPSRTQPQTQNPPSSSSQAQGQDDLARLFAGLSVPVPTSSPRPSIASNNQAISSPAPVSRNGVGNHTWDTKTTNSATTSTQGGPGRPYTQITQTQTTTATYNHATPPARPDTPPSPPITFSELPVASPRSPNNIHPPGQTVADLMNSFGGGPSRSSVSPPPGPPGQTAADLLNSFSGVPNFPILPPPIPPHPHHGTTTKGPSQYSNGPSPPPQSTRNLPLPPQAMRSPPPPPPMNQGPTVPMAQRPREQPPHLDNPLHIQSAPSVPDPVYLQQSFMETLPSNYTPSGPDPRAAFQRDIIDVLQHNQAFVDQLYQAYMARRR